MKSFLKKTYHFLFNESTRIQIKKQQIKLKGLFLKGNNVECNCCGKTYKSFLPFGNSERRENAWCPNCGSLERTRMLLFYLKNETNVFDSCVKVLHFAPEEGLKKIFKQLKNPNDYKNGDINPNFADLLIDITNIQFEDNCFDFVICSHVLGHVPNEARAMTEMYRVLKPGGIAIILTLLNQKDQPTFENPDIDTPEERLMNYGESDLLRLHGNDFKERIEAAGFEVEAFDYTDRLDKAQVERFRLYNPQRGIIFLAKKIIRA
ncbi:MAG: class I SAM-dependent methyltransferase [Moheibacter sp.]